MFQHAFDTLFISAGSTGRLSLRRAIFVFGGHVVLPVGRMWCNTILARIGIGLAIARAQDSRRSRAGACQSVR